MHERFREYRVERAVKLQRNSPDVFAELVSLMLEPA